MEYILKKLIEIIKNVAGDRPVEVILVGRSAMPFYGIIQGTQDIDFEIRGLDDNQFARLKELLDKEQIIADFGEDVSRWSIIPLPEGYRERARIVLEDENVKVKILDPVDFIISKLRRGTAEDEEDAFELCRIKGIKASDIEGAMKMINIPRELESFYFLKRMERFLKKLKEL